MSRLPGDGLTPSFEQRLERIERQIAQWTRRTGKIDSDSSVMPSMDDFNFSEHEFANANAAGGVAWTAPFRFSNGNTRGLTWDSGSGGNLFVNCSVGFIDTTGELLSFVDAAEPGPCSTDTAYRFVKTQYRFYYRHPERAGDLEVEATFSIRNAHIRDSIHGPPEGSGAIDLLDFQNLRIAAYRQRADSWEQFGKVIDEYHELPLAGTPTIAGETTLSHDVNRPKSQHTVVMRSSDVLDKGQLAKFYVGIWAGVTLCTESCSYATFNRFDVQLDKVRAGLL